MAEDVIRSMQNIYGHALAEYQTSKQLWCTGYMDQMRKILLSKYDYISAYTLEYIEKYTIYTQEEMEELKAKASHKKLESNVKLEFYLTEGAKDVKFGIWGNI